MPIVKTIAIHDDKRGLDDCGIYIIDHEKTDLAGHNEKVLTSEEMQSLEQEKILSGEAYLDNAMKYVENEVKTTIHAGDSSEEKDLLVSSINCNLSTAMEEFRQTKGKYERMHNRQEKTIMGTNKQGQLVEKAPIVAYHIIMSFPKYAKIDPHEVHSMGRELIENINADLGCNFQAVVATHMNTQCLHNHILLCNYSDDGKRKVPLSKDYREHIRDMSDTISLQHGFAIPPQLLGRENKKSMNWVEWKSIQDGSTYSWKEDIKEAIRLYATSSSSFTSYVDRIRAAGYGVDIRGEHVTYRTPDGTKRVRDDKLGEEFNTATLKANNGWSDQYMSVEEREKQKTQNNNSEINNQSETQELSTAYKSHELYEPSSAKNRRKKKTKIYISWYAPSGRRRSKLERQILFVIEILKRNKDKWERKNHSTEKTNPIFYPYGKKIDELEKALKTIESYNLSSKDDLINRKNEVTKNLHEAKRREREARKSYDAVRNVQQIAVKAMELKKIAASLGIDIDDLCLDDFPSDIIRQNRAELYPAEGQDRRKLFLLLDENREKYRMMEKLSLLTNEETKTIISYLEGEKMEKPPYPLVSIADYRSIQIEKTAKDMNELTMTEIEALEKARQVSLEKAKYKLGEFAEDQKIQWALKKMKQNNLPTDIKGSGVNGRITKFDLMQIYRYMSDPTKEIKKYFPDEALINRARLVDGKTAQQITELAMLRGITLPGDATQMMSSDAYKLRNYLLHMKEVPECLQHMYQYKFATVPLTEERLVKEKIRTYAEKQMDSTQAFIKKMTDEYRLSEKEMTIMGEYRETMNQLKSFGIEAGELENIYQDVMLKKENYECAQDDLKQAKRDFKEISGAERKWNYYVDRARKKYETARNEAAKIENETKNLLQAEQFIGYTGNPIFVYGPNWDRQDEFSMTDVEQSKSMDMPMEQKEEIVKEKNLQPQTPWMENKLREEEKQQNKSLSNLHTL